MPEIKDQLYKDFITKGLHTPIDKDQFQGMLERIEHPQKTQARALFILLYWTGRRPCEILDLTPENIHKEGRKLKITFPTAKRGFTTTLFYILTPHFKEVWEYAAAAGFPGFKLFWAFRGKKGGGKHIKRVKWVTQKGEKRVKEYNVISRRLRYWVEKWAGTTPYYFRHNRFSSMSASGARQQEILFAKGGRSLASVQPYIGLSKEQASRISKYFK